MMPAARISAIVCFVLAAGCAGIEETPPSVPARPLPVDPSVLGRNRDKPVADLPLRSEAIQKDLAVASPPVAPRRPTMTANTASGNEPVAAAPAPPSASQGAAKAASPPAKAPAKIAATAVAIEQPRKNVDASPVAKKLEPPLDIAALKARLRETNAIGVFTKLALKNQVDDLLQQFRAHYLGGQKTSVAALRQPYDMLVLKVLALVQDSDPSLARTISGSREAIWGILADPEKFNSVT